MTHPIYTAATLEALTVAELKTIASQLGAIPDGDKRVKQTWVSAVLDHQTKFSPAKVEAMAAHIETVMTRSESITPAVSELPSELPAIDSYVPTPRTHADDEAFAAAMGLTYDDVFGEPVGSIEAEEQTATVLNPNSTQRGASIVVLVAVLAFAVAFLVIKTGFTSIAWVIAALSPLVWGLWRYLLPDSKSGESIDYFPNAVA
jgi:hypothetical protein